MQNIFYGTRGNRNGSIMIVGESWGSEEARQLKPFVGATGQDLERLLAESGIASNECFFTNVVSEQPFMNDISKFFYTNAEAKKHHQQCVKGLYPQTNVILGLQRLKAQINAIKPKLIIGLGNYALWALTDDSFDINATGTNTPTGIGKWRGSQLYTSHELGLIPFLPTYHPAAAMHSAPAWRYMIKHDLSVRAKLAFNNQWKAPDYEFTVRPSFELTTSFLQSIIDKLENQVVQISLDVETPPDGFLSCIGLSLTPCSAFCVPFFERNSRFEDRYWSFEEEVTIVELLRKILSHDNLRLIGQNLLFDVQILVEQLFIKPRIWFDTMVAQHVLYPGGGEERKNEEGKQEAKRQSAQGITRKALFNLSSLYCKHHTYWKEDRKSDSEETYWRYNCTDAARTFEICEQQSILLNKFGLQEQFEFQVCVANDMALSMMLRGIKVDEKIRQNTVDKLETALQEFDVELIELIPLEMRKLVEPKTYKKNPITGIKEKAQWFTSSSQQKIIFYDFCGLKPIIHPKTKQPTLNKEALPILANREPILIPIVEKLETRRSVGVYLSTFGRAELDDDGRMRCSYNPTGTDTFRFSSSENIHGRGGNLQNIPSGKENENFQFPNMRMPFVPDEGYEIAEYDLSGADAAVVAWEANDEMLKEAFRKGVKLHLKNSRDLFPDETKNMTDDEIKAGSGIPGSIYDGAKKGVHGTNYGAMPKTLATKLKWSMAKAEEFQERWFTVHPGIKEWHERTDNYLTGVQCWRCDNFISQGRKCQSCGATTGNTVGNRFGYRIIYFDNVGNLLNKALAWCPQSTVGINANKGAIKLVQNLPWIELLLQVHDSIVVQYPIKYAEPEYQIQIKNLLHSVIVPYADPLQIKWGLKTSRKNWGEAVNTSWPED